MTVARACVGAGAGVGAEVAAGGGGGGGETDEVVSAGCVSAEGSESPPHAVAEISERAATVPITHRAMITRFMTVSPP